jgi:hypothetical protein
VVLQGSDSLKARLSAATSTAATVHRVGSCEGGPGAPLRDHPLPDLSGSTSGSPAVVLVCTSPEDTLEHEAAVLGALRTAVGAKRHLFVYASEPVVRLLSRRCAAPCIVADCFELTAGTALLSYSE